MKKTSTWSERFWQWLAWQLSKPAIFEVLSDFAIRRPYQHIHDADRSLYMGRWWVLKESTWFPYAARLHYIARPDRDRHLHDHPYDFRTLILKGGYDELDIFGNTHGRYPGTSYARRAQEYHKITEMLGEDGGAWTLFIYRHRKVSNPWGFLTTVGQSVRKVHWREYLNEPTQD